MSLNFEFATAARIVFGSGSLRQVGKLAAGLGRRALIATGFVPERCQSLLDLLSTAGVTSTLFLVDGEPSAALIQDGVSLARQDGCDLMIGFGGGSAIDTGKAIAALAANDGPLLDYLEVVGRGQALARPSLPCLAIPTTAGTGAEVTRNAVIRVPTPDDPQQHVKVSLRSPWMLPRVALVDPELTYSLPPEVTASTGLDALTQLIEPFTCSVPNPLTDAVCRDGLVRVARSLRRAVQAGQDPAAREDMSLASLFGGLALANARLGAVHGFAGVLGGMYPAPHGAICARLLPLVTEANLCALHRRAPEHPALARYSEAARLLTGDPSASAEDAIPWLQSLVDDLGIPSLAQSGVQAEAFPQIIAASLKASSMQGNPIALTGAELQGILEKAL